MNAVVERRLEAIRQSIKDEDISMGELAELDELKYNIRYDDVELLEWAGFSEDYARGLRRIHEAQEDK